MSRAAKRNSRVLVTGAAGLLGRHVVAALTGLWGVDVIAASRSTLPHQGIQVRDYAQCPPADFIVHLAEEPGRTNVNRQGETYLESSAATVCALRDLAGAMLIYASSGVIYGDQGTEPYDVGSPTFVVDTYSQSKVANEALVLAAGGCVLRFSNLIGVGMSSQNVLSDILSQVPGEGPLTVRDTAPVRDYLPIMDAACAVMHAIQSAQLGIFNVGSGIGTSVMSLASGVLKHAGEATRQVMSSATSIELSNSYNVLDISRTSAELGWSPKITLQHELAELLRKKIEVYS